MAVGKGQLAIKKLAKVSLHLARSSWQGWKKDSEKARLISWAVFFGVNDHMI